MNTRRDRLLERNRWVAYLLPLIVFMLVGSLEPPREAESWLGLRFEHFPLVYAARIVATLAAVAFVWPVFRELGWRVTPLSALVGVVGGGLWIWLCWQDWEQALLPRIGLTWWLESTLRTAYNPQAELGDNQAALYSFLAVRFLGLVVVVPIIEELFLRGFVMRVVIDPDWWKVPFGTVTPAAVAAGTILPVLMHPASEFFAVVVWFSLVTVLMAYTKSFWDCVIAHAITNLMLGIYVVRSGDWQLW
jgi:CAAX prenyl protease-like protein